MNGSPGDGALVLYDEIDLAYAAGIIDGEGYIGFNIVNPSESAANHRVNPSVIPTVAVTMTDIQVPVWLAETFGGFVGSYPPRNPRHKGHATWRIANRAAESFCRIVVENLRVKRPQAELVIAYYADPRFTVGRGQRRGQTRILPPEEVAARLEYRATSRLLNKKGAITND